MNIPEIQPGGDAHHDAFRRASLERFAEWIENNGGLDAAEELAREAEANAHSRLCACFWHGDPDSGFQSGDHFAEHESAMWRRDRTNWRNALETLALFRAVNPKLEKAA